ncbi:antitoxin Xre/MbcA/ParS toxin-binding domain-containing protein [Caballeronia novacaledonica]|nr:antitoxin Xre/MbcA/ParS toxin-binding domain-containing protein [Caballeronia novacaledonica]
MQRPRSEHWGLKALDVLDSQPGYDRVHDILMRITSGVAA